MRCALLQINTRVGDIAGNADLIALRAREAAARGADLVLTPEMALTGCPPHDLLLSPGLAEKVEEAALALARRLASGPALVLGAIGRDKGCRLFNRALFLTGGRVAAVYDKQRLSTRKLFDETRYFAPGSAPALVEFQGRRLFLTIGGDIWPGGGFSAAELPPFDVLVNISASPFAAGEGVLRQGRLSALARRLRTHLLQVNLAGGNDELIFDGRSLWAGPDGEILARGCGFAEDIVLADLARPEPALAPDDFTPESEHFRALTLGLADYCAKTGFRRVILGLSGGIDSALAAALAAAALGPENVRGLLLPSPHSPGHSLSDALDLAANLRIKTETIPIRPLMEAYEKILAGHFAGLATDTTEENIQARIRGNILMAFANKFGELLITTSNKSETAVGYSTIYGDMCGGLAVLGDLYKTEVFRLCRWLNAERELIPQNTLTKAPSAELRPGQIDQDSLPPYDELDLILRGLLEERRETADLAAAGFDAAVVKQVAALVRAAEFKRRQGAPMLKVSADDFGAGWRLPLTGVLEN
jgi:NAD+ synthetase